MNFYFNSTRLQDFFSEAQALHVIFVPHISSFVTNLRFQNLVSIVYHLACAAGGIVSTRFKFLRRSRDQKKGSGDEAYSARGGSAAKSHSTDPLD